MATRPEINPEEISDNDSLIPQYITFRGAATKSKGSAAPLAPSSGSSLRDAADQEEGAQLAREFLARLLSLFTQDIKLIASPEERYKRGTLELPGGQTVEVIRQSINPARYPLNAARVAELTFNPILPGTLALLARTLDIETDVLRNCQVADYRIDGHPSAPLGDPGHVFITCAPSKVAKLTMYINPRDGHIYMYRPKELFDHIKKAITNQNFRRAQDGRSMDLLTVLIPLSQWRFTRGKDGLWRYTGLGNAENEKNELRRWLSP